MTTDFSAADAAALVGRPAQDVLSFRLHAERVVVVTTDGQKLVGVLPSTPANKTPSAARPDLPRPESQSAGAPSGAPAATEADALPKSSAKEADVSAAATGATAQAVAPVPGENTSKATPAAAKTQAVSPTGGKQPARAKKAAK